MRDRIVIEKGNPATFYSIGWIYQKGQRNYPKDYKKVEEWYLKTADVNSRKKNKLGLQGFLFVCWLSNQQRKI